ncbi:hypothetical protein [Streptomyces sp. NPDC055097]
METGIEHVPRSRYGAAVIGPAPRTVHNLPGPINVAGAWRARKEPSGGNPAEPDDHDDAAAAHPSGTSVRTAGRAPGRWGQGSSQTVASSLPRPLAAAPLGAK